MVEDREEREVAPQLTKYGYASFGKYIVVEEPVFGSGDSRINIFQSPNHYCKHYGQKMSSQWWITEGHYKERDRIMVKGKVLRFFPIEDIKYESKKFRLRSARCLYLVYYMNESPRVFRTLRGVSEYIGCVYSILTGRFEGEYSQIVRKGYSIIRYKIR